ncbi:MAG TPA: RDD family protein [Paucimonas sp.]|nr:RDD family protein [Paucimonas sp.]
MNDAKELEYVGFWPRVLASVIDLVLSGLILLPLGNFVYGGYPLMGGGALWMTAHSNFWTSTVLPAVAVVAFWILKNATPGKMVIRATIVDAKTGEAPGTTQYIIRYLGYYLSMIPLFLGFVWIAFDPKKQGWHDKLAGTVVVRPKQRGTEPVNFDEQAG